jgi:hypothetical protein
LRLSFKLLKQLIILFEKDLFSRGTLNIAPDIKWNLSFCPQLWKLLLCIVEESFVEPRTALFHDLRDPILIVNVFQVQREGSLRKVVFILVRRTFIRAFVRIVLRLKFITIEGTVQVVVVPLNK